MCGRAEYCSVITQAPASSRRVRFTTGVMAAYCMPCSLYCAPIMFNGRKREPRIFLKRFCAHDTTKLLRRKSAYRWWSRRWERRIRTTTKWTAYLLWQASNFSPSVHHTRLTQRKKSRKIGGIHQQQQEKFRVVFFFARFHHCWHATPTLIVVQQCFRWQRHNGAQLSRKPSFRWSSVRDYSEKL